MKDGVENAGERGPALLRRYIPAAVTLAVGLAISFWSFAFLRSSQWRSIERQFDRAAERTAEAVRQEVGRNLTILEAPRSFFLASDEVTRREFKTFSEPFLAELEETLVWEWLPRVADASRAEFERASRKEGLPGFQIIECNDQRNLIRAGRREEYFPIFYLEPSDGNESILGFDTASDATRRDALFEARDRDRMVATPVVPLIRNQHGQDNGILVVVPIFKGLRKAETVAERRRCHRGFIVSVLFVDRLVEKALRVLPDEQISINVCDVTDPQSKQRICWRFPAGSSNAQSGKGPSDDALQSSVQISVAGRRWSICCTGLAGFVAARRTWEPWGTLAVGLILTGLLTSQIVASIRRAVSVERLVAQRTRQLRESEQEVRTILDTVEVGIVVVDAATHRLVDVNPVAAAIFGASKDQLVGKSCHSVICPATEGTCPVTEQSERLCNRECVFKNRDGEPVSILKTAAPVILGGRPCILESFVDISDRRRAEVELERRSLALESANRALQDAIRVAEAANNAKSEFLTTMSHELRTPLHGILSFAMFGIKGAGTDSPEELLECFRTIEQCGQTLLRLVNDLLDLAKLESGRMDFVFARVELAQLVSAAIEELRPLAAGRDIRLEIDAAAATSWADVDSVRMLQVLRNLLDNAIKFSSLGGVVETRLAEQGSHLAVSVCDRGVGIPEEELEAIFDKFVRSNTTRAASGGTGLGLAICRDIVDAHGGRIWAENRPGGGAMVTFLIPRQRQPVAVDADPAVPPALSAPLTALV
jgi:PAS domain S-box-containing protein